MTEQHCDTAQKCAKLIQEIEDRQQIIKEYQSTGAINRAYAISKIVELRRKDTIIGSDYQINTSVTPYGPLERCSTEVIINEIYRQITILEGELAKKALESTP